MKKITFVCLFFMWIGLMVSNANNLNVSNVTMLNENTVNKTVEIQFDLSWEHSWRDAINWDAAWVFVKFRNADSIWTQVQLTPTGYFNGNGTSNSIQVTADSVGAFIYRDQIGEGSFTATGLKFLWNYGAQGLLSIINLEIRLFAMEMVYVPQGEFYAESVEVAGAQGMHPVIGNGLSPVLSYNGATIRIDGENGVDFDGDGAIDNPAYPTGYKAFYIQKYELTEGQFADFLNTLNADQQNYLYNGCLWSFNISLSLSQQNGIYQAAIPNRACQSGEYFYLEMGCRFLSLSDWAGLRPMTHLEFDKAFRGPLSTQKDVDFDYAYETRGIVGEENGTETAQPGWGGYANHRSTDYSNPMVRSGIFATDSTDRQHSGASYYGIMEMYGNLCEYAVNLKASDFDAHQGNGNLSPDYDGYFGYSNVSNWPNPSSYYYNNEYNYDPIYGNEYYIGYRFVRTAE